MNSPERPSAKGWLSSGSHPARPVALGDSHELLQEEGQPDGRHQRLLALGVTQRNEDTSGGGEAPAGSDESRQREGGRQQGGGGEACKRQRGHRRRVAAGGCELAEGEVDPPDQAIDQRIGRGQQGIDCRQRQSVERHLQRVGDVARQFRRAAEVAKRGRVGGAALGRRQPVANEKIKSGPGQRLAVERQRDEIAQLARPPRLAEPAGRRVRLRVLAGRLGEEGDGKAPAIRVRPLRLDGDPRVFRHQGGQSHAAQPGLICLQRRRTAGEPERREENPQARKSSSRSPMRQVAVLPPLQPAYDNRESAISATRSSA